MYVDGFVMVIPKSKVAAYRNMAKKAGKIWMDHGALQYMECQGDDLKTSFGISFVKLAKCKPSEVPFFSFIIYKSKSHRNSVNKKVMKDPRMDSMMNAPMPFDPKKMSYGGFKALVSLP